MVWGDYTGEGLLWSWEGLKWLLWVFFMWACIVRVLSVCLDLVKLKDTTTLKDTTVITRGVRHDRKMRILSHYQRLYILGIDIGLENEQKLRLAGMIDLDRQNVKVKSIPRYIRKEHAEMERGPTRMYEYERDVQGLTDVIDESVVDSTTDEDILQAEEDIARHSRQRVRFSGKSNVEKKDWMLRPDEVCNYSEEFYRWIRSICTDFRSIEHYKKFDLYRQQAYHWLSEKITFPALGDIEAQIAYLEIERKRCLTNSLYAMNKFLRLKQGHMEGGSIPFEAWLCQEVMLYLYDLMLSIMIAKPRQIGSTSVLGGASIKNTMLSKSRITKFVTTKASKGEEITDDKVLFALSNFPYYLVPTVSNQRDRLIRFSTKDRKGRVGGVNSKFIIEAPYPTVVNGGSPDEVLLDEAGLMDIIDEILGEGRPTMFLVDPETNKMKIVRRVIAWGTGGDMDKHGHVFEQEMRSVHDAFMDRDYSSGFVPLVFNAYARKGVTKVFIDQEKNEAYRKKGPKAQKARMKFHQTYPMGLDDIFLRSSDTLIPMPEIIDHIRRIEKLPAHLKPTKGYFEPVFDYSKEYDENSDVPYAIVGAEFVPLDESDSENYYDAPVTMFMRKDRENWDWRYFQGTDPLLNPSSGGSSNFASAIWDNVIKTVSCVVNAKGRSVDDYRYPMLQTTLMGIYYNGKQIRDLCEENAGKTYEEYKENKGLWKTLVANSELPDQLRTSMVNTGIKKEGRNKKFIIHKLEELIELYANNICIPEFYYQLKTFVRKETRGGETKFEPQDKRYFKDDILDAVVYAYICAECYKYKLATKGSVKESKKKTGRKLISNASTGYTVQLASKKFRGTPDKSLRYTKYGRR